MTIGDRIKNARIQKGLSQDDIAKAIKSTRQAVYKYENGIVTNIPMNKLEMIANILNVTPAYLMGWNETTEAETSPSNKKDIAPLKDYEVFKKNLLQHCKRMALPPAQVFERVGIPSSEYDKWSSENYPSEESIRKLAKLFHVPIEHLTEDQESTAEQKDNLNFLERNGVRFIPVYENVSAGFGVCAIDDVVEYIPLYIVNHQEAEETLCIKVRGDSMSPKIEDGDLIQVHKQTSVDSGSIAVVMLDGEEFLVKQVLLGETWVELRSINPLYKPFRFNGAEASRVQIVGLVKKIIKDV